MDPLASLAALNRRRYLDLLKGCLTRSLFPEAYLPAERMPSIRAGPKAWAIYSLLNPPLSKLGLRLIGKFNAAQRKLGRDWPADAETMIGRVRLDNLQECVAGVLERGVPGDLIETGVWRGGACIFMRAMLEAYGDPHRAVWVADSFEGLPKPDGRHAQDAGDRHWQYAGVLAVPLDQVKAAFERYGLLDERVRFLPGWFKDTLPSAPIEKLAVLRMDGDMYGSTMDALVNLYPKLSPGGYAIVDDYGAVPGCRQAVEDYRAQNGVTEPIQPIDGSGVFWEKR